MYYRKQSDFINNLEDAYFIWTYKAGFIQRTLLPADHPLKIDLKQLFNSIIPNPDFAQETLYQLTITFVLYGLVLFIIQNVIFARFTEGSIRGTQFRTFFFKEPLVWSLYGIFKYCVTAARVLLESLRTLIPYSTKQLHLYGLGLAAVTLIHTINKFWSTPSFITIHMDLEYMVFRTLNWRPSITADQYSAVFMLTIITVGLWANTATVLYMSGEFFYKKFESLLNMFLYSMLFLVLSNNLVSLLIFWELIGFSSFFLINFYSTKTASFKSAMKALSFNQISDVCLIIALILYYQTFNHLEFPNSNAAQLITSKNVYSNTTTMTVCFFIAAYCKSVQFPFHFWLPDSMDAPAPASALIHSATLVAAGIYLILRLKPILILAPVTTTIFSYFSLITIVLGGLAAITHFDLKKILAYSTVANCGYLMFLTINADEKYMLLFFLVHGLLKGFTFIIVSIWILELDHRQDIRLLTRSFFTKHVLVCVTVMAFMGLGALPLSPSIIIKEEVLMNINNTYTNDYVTNYALIIGSVTSAVYSLKIIFLLLKHPYAKSRIFPKFVLKELPEPVYNRRYVLYTIIIQISVTLVLLARRIPEADSVFILLNPERVLLSPTTEMDRFMGWLKVMGWAISVISITLTVTIPRFFSYKYLVGYVFATLLLFLPITNINFYFGPVYEYFYDIHQFIKLSILFTFDNYYEGQAIYYYDRHGKLLFYHKFDSLLLLYWAMTCLF